MEIPNALVKEITVKKANGHTVPKASKSAPSKIVAKKKAPKFTDTEALLTCRECGRQFSSMKRHVRESHGLSYDQYRKKHNLGADYPTISFDLRQAYERSSALGREAKAERRKNGGKAPTTGPLAKATKLVITLALPKRSASVTTILGHLGKYGIVINTEIHVPGFKKPITL